MSEPPMPPDPLTPEQRAGAAGPWLGRRSINDQPPEVMIAVCRILRRGFKRAEAAGRWPPPPKGPDS